MDCRKVEELFAEYLVTGESPERSADFREHVQGCQSCAKEWRVMQKTWDAMGSMPEEEPSPEVRVRFYQMLEAYEAGRSEAVRQQTGSQQKTRNWWSVLWPQQPALQFGGALAMLAVGLTVGHFYMGSSTATVGGNAGSQEISQLQGEVRNMRQLVTLSLLQQQSASDRLQGVNWSYRVEPNDTDVLSALLKTVNHDSSVDVRLSAVDALKSFSHSPVAQHGLIQALGKQESPLVQVAILDALSDNKQRDAAPAIRVLMDRKDLDPTVRKHAEAALQHLEVLQ